jgi:NTE family protein
MMDRALVLGGGGPVGIAWEAGLAAGLLAEGVDLARADRTIGTSAGSFVGAHLAGGLSAQELYEAQIAVGEQDAAERATGNVPPSRPDPTPFLALVIRPLDEGETPEMRRVKMGELALKTQTATEEAFIDGFGPLVRALPWPQGYACTTVDARTGVFRLWEVTDGVELPRAIASSCAVPGIFPPISINGQRYIDGGARSPTCVDMAAGARRVVTVAVVGVMAREAYLARIAEEAKALGDAAQVLITPDEAALEVFGPNLLDVRDRAAVARSGHDQGRREAGRVGKLWGI